MTQKSVLATFHTGTGRHFCCCNQTSYFVLKFSIFQIRDSQLTKLLADSLAGNGVTLMVNQHISHFLFARTVTRI